MVRNIIKNSNTYLTALAMCAAIASCTSDEDIVQKDGKKSSEITCEVKAVQSADELGSRSALTLGSGKMDFAWTDDDVMTVMAYNNNNARQLYRLQSGANSPDAKFYTEDFQLTKNQLYYSFSKSVQAPHVTISDQNNITVNYAGQVQEGNASTSHLGDYDFMAAGTVCTDINSTHFYFDHLGATLRVVMGFSPEELPSGSDERKALEATTDPAATDGAVRMTRFTEMEIYDSDNSFRQPERYFSFLTGTENNNGVYSYTFKWKDQEITSMERFKITLRSKDNPDEGIKRTDPYNDGKTNSSNKLIVYMEVPPADFTSKKVGIMMKGYYEKYEGGTWKKHDVSYVASYDSGWKFGGVTTYKVDAGKACQISVAMKKPDDFNVSLKVNHMWQHGSTLDQTSRATGDPGYDKEIITPTHIYYIYCHDGKVIKPTKEASAQAVTHIAGAKWTTQNNDGVYISTFTGTGTSSSTDNGIINLQKPECTAGHTCTYHLYVVASNSELNLSAAENDTEESIQGKLYNLPSTGVQTFMRDLYSTPWDATSFVGDITDPVQDVTLYHVAAKVDLKWNSATAVKSVSANDVKKQELYIFKPTENTDGIVSSGYTETFSLADNVDQWYNGRYVLYLPQFTSDCSYKVGLNTEVETITFTSVSTQGGFTSWLRWLKQK